MSTENENSGKEFENLFNQRFATKLAEWESLREHLRQQFKPKRIETSAFSIQYQIFGDEAQLSWWIKSQYRNADYRLVGFRAKNSFHSEPRSAENGQRIVSTIHDDTVIERL